MQHTSGWEELRQGIAQKGKENIPSLDFILRNSEPHQINEPGKFVSYSNYGTTIAGRIIEIISKKSYSEYIKENIFNKLNMNKTTVDPTFNDNLWIKENYKLKGYTISNNKISITPQNDFVYLIYPAGSSVGTLEDITKYLISISQRNCILFENPLTYDKYFNFTTYLSNDFPLNSHGFWANYYLNMSISREHDGATFRCSTQLVFLPESGWGMIVLTNTIGENHFTSKLRGELFGLPTFPEYEGKLPDPSEIEGDYLGLRAVFVGFSSIFSKLTQIDSVKKINQTHIKISSLVFKQIRPYIYYETSKTFSNNKLVVFELKDNKKFKLRFIARDNINVSKFFFSFYLLSLLLVLVCHIYFSIVFWLTILKILLNLLNSEFWNNFNIFSYLINIQISIEYIKSSLLVLLFVEWIQLPLPGALNTKIFIYSILFYLSWINLITISILSFYNKYSNIQNTNNQIQLSTFINKQEDFEKNEIEEEFQPLFFQKNIYLFINYFLIIYYLFIQTYFEFYK